MKRFFTSTLLALVFAVGAMAETSQEEVIELNFNKPDYTFTYYAQNSDWYFGCTDVTTTYILRLDYVAPSDQPYGTLTCDNLDMTYSYLDDYSSGQRESRYFKEGTSLTISETDDILSIEGTLVCDDGKTYHVSTDFPPYHRQQVDIEATTLAAAINYGGDWFVRFENDDWFVTLDIVTDTFAGTYTEMDAYGDDYCLAATRDNKTRLMFSTFNVTMEGGNPEEACTIKGTASTARGDMITFNLEHGTTDGIRTINTDTKAKAKKFIQNGSVVIKKDNMTYKVTGTRSEK